MRFAIVAHRQTETNEALAAAAGGAVLAPRRALHSLAPGDVALARLDVLETLDGIEPGATELERLASAGVTVLNLPRALAAAHDKLLTARVLRRHGLPHPHSWLFAADGPTPVPSFPVVLKPRFGSWGRDVFRCDGAADFEAVLARLARRPWFHDHGALAQELIGPRGWDLRVVVAGGRVVGCARRVAAPGEWRTNVALGGRSERARPPRLARELALAAAGAVGGDLVGVDLLPTGGGFVVAEVNAAVDLKPHYRLGRSDVHGTIVRALLDVAAHTTRAPAA